MKVILFYDTEFDAAHNLPHHDGECSRVHGHTYRTEVQVEGVIQDDTGMVIDFGDLKRIVDEALPDHKHLNYEINAEFPTVENIIHIVALRIAQSLPSHIRIVYIRIWEGMRKGAILDRRITEERYYEQG